MSHDFASRSAIAKVKFAIILLSAAVVAYGLIGGMMNGVSARDDAYRDLSIFTDVLSKVKDDYVEEPDIELAMHGALMGMMEALDPYSSFVPAETYERLRALDPEKSASPGIFLSKRYGYAYVVSVLPGSPAARLGIRSGDLFESIDGQATTQLSLWEAQRRLLGPEGTHVDVRLVRGRRTEPSWLQLQRELPRKLEPASRLVDGEIGLVRIFDLNEGTADSLRSKLKVTLASGAKGLVVDLRGVVAGTLEEVLSVSGLFLGEGKPVVSVKEREGKETKHSSKGDSLLTDLPLVVLADSGTSGAAEVLLAALADHEVATIVGEKTDGRGAEQEMFRLEDGSVLFLSTGAYFRPSGQALLDRNLRNSGVNPDVRAPSEEVVSNFYFENTPEDVDAPLSDEFYRKFNEVVQVEQLNVALQQIRSMLLKKAA